MSSISIIQSDFNMSRIRLGGNLSFDPFLYRELTICGVGMPILVDFTGTPKLPFIIREVWCLSCREVVELLKFNGDYINPVFCSVCKKCGRDIAQWSSKQ